MFQPLVPECDAEGVFLTGDYICQTGKYLSGNVTWRLPRARHLPDQCSEWRFGIQCFSMIFINSWASRE